MATEKSALTPYAQKLRSNMTPQELKLWNRFLRKLDVTVKRQKTIGPYIVDFYIPAAKAVIEADGSQHYESAGRSQDLERDQYLQKKGISVLRYSNADIDLRFQSVCEDIMLKLNVKVKP